MGIIYNGDCLEEYKKIQKESVDLILCDPPYGTIKDLGKNLKSNFKKSNWDDLIDFKKMFNMAFEVLKPNSKLILFSQEPFTSDLIKNCDWRFNFNYKLFWIKHHHANHLSAKKAHLNYVEEILIFTKKDYDFNLNHPLRQYMQELKEYILLTEKTLTNIDKKFGNTMPSSHYFCKSMQLVIPSEKQYNKMIELFNINKMNGFKKYEEIDIIKKSVKKESVYNLNENQKYRKNILEYKKDYPSLHTTQKPVALLEEIIETFTNKNDCILDFTAGSGSTAIACINKERDYIMIEQDKEYFKIMSDRINKHLKEKV